MSTTTTCRAVYRDTVILTADECLEIVTRKLHSSDARVVAVTTRPLGDAPVGFLGDHYRLDVEVKIDAEPRSDTLVHAHFFVKTLPVNEVHTEFVHSSGAFEKERGFYSVLLSELTKYQNDAQVVGSARWTCQCYLANDKLVVLDDLSVDGYRILEKRARMDYAHCVVTLESLARFHASSIVYEEKRRRETGVACKLNDVYPRPFDEALWVSKEGHPGRALCDGGVKALVALLKYLPDMVVGSERYAMVRRRLDGIFDETSAFMGEASGFKSVITHGDLWANNILIRYENDLPVDAKFVDFQLLRYTLPAHDFLCFLHLNTRRDFRDQRLLDLARVYHRAIKTELARHSIQVDHHLPWDQFTASLDRWRGLGILECVIYFLTTLMPGSVTKDIFASPERFQKYMLEDRSEESCLCYETDSLYREIITEALQELIQYYERTQ